jgi:1,4-dihydroxy-2-naphthoate octaprenyltransferase
MRDEDKSIVERYPVSSVIVASILCLLFGFLLILTAVGSIIGIPMMGLGIILAVIGAYLYRKGSPDESATVDEVDDRFHNRA